MSNTKLIGKLRALAFNAMVVMNDATALANEMEQAESNPKKRTPKNKSTLTQEQLYRAANLRRSRIKLIDPPK